ncbi:MAG: 50S ribosomal protein L9 [Chloroflexota bacterium]|nr:50S ribosomal protein L9 [Chloroflexota bacterium]
MKVVLLEEVQGLGAAGTVKDVADGYARNFLLPRKLAAPATPAALKQVEQLKAAEERRQAKADAQAAGIASRLDGQEVMFRVRVGEGGRLYGSVTNVDIAEVLTRQTGEEIDRRRIILDEPIHSIGTYEVPVRLSASHIPTVRVIVEAES